MVSSGSVPNDAVLISEMPQRYTLACVEVVNRATEKVESTIFFTRDEIDMPGYVESVERGYEDTSWSTRRVWGSARSNPTIHPH